MLFRSASFNRVPHGPIRYMEHNLLFSSFVLYGLPAQNKKLGRGHSKEKSLAGARLRISQKQKKVPGSGTFTFELKGLHGLKM